MLCLESKGLRAAVHIRTERSALEKALESGKRLAREPENSRGVAGSMFSLLQRNYFAQRSYSRADV